MSRLALSLIALAIVGGCSGRDATSPMSPLASPRATTVSPSESFPRGGALHFTKDCSEYLFLAGSFCTVTSSNLEQIEVGSRIIYGAAAGATELNADVILDTPGPGNNAAVGHCRLVFATSLGLCTFSGGTGKFTHLHASVVVSSLGNRKWALDGTYSFDPRD